MKLYIKDNGTFVEIPALKGDRGSTVVRVEKVSTEGYVDTYNMVFDDGQTFPFTVTNGHANINADEIPMSAEDARKITEAVAVLNQANKVLIGNTVANVVHFYNEDTDSPVYGANVNFVGNKYEKWELRRTASVPRLHKVSSEDVTPEHIYCDIDTNKLMRYSEEDGEWIELTSDVDPSNIYVPVEMGFPEPVEMPLDNATKTISKGLFDLGSDVSELEEGKQDKLTAGANITIENNVISATGGGGGDDAMRIIPTATADLLTLKDSANAPLRGVTIYGHSTQDGTPTPEAPIAIENTEDASVEIYGRNLLDFAHPTSGVRYGTITQIKDGFHVKTSGASATAHYLIKVKKGYKYRIYTYDRINVQGQGGGFVCSVYDGENTSSPKLLSNVSCTYKDSPKVFTPTSEYVYITISLSGGAAAQEYDLIIPQVILGETPMSRDNWEAYIPQQTAQIHTTLRGVKVTSGGNYTDENGQQWVCDTLELQADGSGLVTRRIDAMLDTQTATAEHSDCILSTTTTEIIPKEQMVQFLQLHTLKPITTAFVDKPAGIGLTYVADPKNYIDNKIANVTALALNV